MPPTDKRDDSHHQDNRNNFEHTGNNNRPLWKNVRLTALSRLLTVRVVGIAAIAALATTVLTIVTVTGVTQKRAGSNPPSGTANGSNNGASTTTSNALSSGSRDTSSSPQTPQIMRGAHTTQTVVPIDMSQDLRTLRHIPAGPRIELPEFRRHGDGRAEEREREEKETSRLTTLATQSSNSFDALRQLLIPTPNMPALNVSFDGQDLTASGCNCSPPDTVGDIGSNHYRSEEHTSELQSLAYL